MQTLIVEAIVVSVGEVLVEEEMEEALVEEETEEVLLETEVTLLEMEETPDVILGFVQTLLVKSSFIILHYILKDYLHA